MVPVLARFWDYGNLNGNVNTGNVFQRGTRAEAKSQFPLDQRGNEISVDRDGIWSKDSGSVSEI